MLSLSILLLSLACQATNVPLEKEPVKSLTTLVLEEYPEANIQRLDVSDFDFAYALGSYLYHSKRQRLSINPQVHNEIMIDVDKLRKVLFEELIEAQVDSLNPISNLRSRLGAFVKENVNTEKLNIEFFGVKNGKEELSLSTVHKIIAKCAINQIAVVSIDIAILKWVVKFVRDGSIKSEILYGTWDPLVDSPLCKALLALMFYPEINIYVEKELNEFIGSLKGQPNTGFDDFGRSIVGLMLPLPEGRQKQVLADLISGSSIHKYIANNPDVTFSDMLISFEHVNKVKRLRENTNMRILLAASSELLSIGTQTDRLNVLSTLKCFYFYKSKGLQRVEKYRSSSLLIKAERGKEGCDVFVGSLIPLSEDVLGLLGRYARGVKLSERDEQDLFYAQAAFGIVMIVAPRIKIH